MKRGFFWAYSKEGREEEEDWYLTSGGMCQRNSCRVGKVGFERRNLWERLLISWQGSWSFNSHYTTVPKDC
jgi:hypothetical protein